jgi:hypothetical protein
MKNGCIILLFLSDKVAIIYLKVLEFHHLLSMSFIAMLFISHNPSKSIFKYWYVLISEDIQPSINYKMYVLITELQFIIQLKQQGRVMVMVFNTTFNNISVISWWSVL